VVVERAGDSHTEPPGPGWRFERLSIPRLDVSSSDVRARLAAGRPVDGLLPPAVIAEIRARGLYTAP
jgi:nicotinate-nucleotide adenylyltransferase